MNTAHLKRFAALLSLALVVTSCSDTSPTGPVARANPPEANLLGGLLGKLGLLSCRPLPPASASKTIGRSGGVIHIGPHTFTVPAGALDHNVTITASAPSDKYNRVDFGPSGLQFSKSASLSMSYANCSLLGDLLPKHIAYVDQHLSILYLLQSVDNLLTQKVTGKVDHFSEYALAW
ncbi:MAG: hypothetical protein ACREN6_16530 [Gemmatimonadaceae bacterium]